MSFLLKINLYHGLTVKVNRIINDSMNEKELTYNTALDIVFMNKCHNCGCTPKNDEWSNRAKNLCIDCQDDS
jgi:hypothetical protein